MGEGDLKELRELVEFLKASGVAEFDMERPELKVRLTFAQAAAAVGSAAGVGAAGVSVGDWAQLARLMAAGAGAAVAPAAIVPAEVAHVTSATATPAAVSAASVTPVAAAEDDEAGLHIVKSPLVGTFYDAPSPGADTFVKVGDKVASGKVLCIVEAMKIMNEIESDAAGEVVKVYPKTGQPVEYGQKLFAVRV